jgi:hypothetical protein
VARSGVVMSGGEWCAQISGRSPPFIALRGGRGVARQSSTASSFQGLQGASDGRAALATSRRG